MQDTDILAFTSEDITEEAMLDDFWLDEDGEFEEEQKGDIHVQIIRRLE